MDSHALDILEFDRVRQILAEHASCARGRRMALQLAPTRREDLVQRWLAQVQELIDAAAEIDLPPLGGVRDIRDIVRAAVPPHSPDPEDFATIAETLRATHEVVRWAGRLREEAGELRAV